MDKELVQMNLALLERVDFSGLHGSQGQQLALGLTEVKQTLLKMLPTEEQQLPGNPFEEKKE